MLTISTVHNNLPAPEETPSTESETRRSFCGLWEKLFFCALEGEEVFLRATGKGVVKERGWRPRGTGSIIGTISLFQTKICNQEPEIVVGSSISFPEVFRFGCTVHTVGCSRSDAVGGI